MADYPEEAIKLFRQFIPAPPGLEDYWQCPQFNHSPKQGNNWCANYYLFLFPFRRLSAALLLMYATLTYDSLLNSTLHHETTDMT